MRTRVVHGHGPVGVPGALDGAEGLVLASGLLEFERGAVAA